MNSMVVLFHYIIIGPWWSYVLCEIKEHFALSA